MTMSKNLTGLVFEHALFHLRCGRRAAREGWKNVKYVMLMTNGGIGYSDEKDERGLSKPVLALDSIEPFFVAVTAIGRASVWTPSTQDILADDWYVIVD